jgi:hypothetical protein
MASKIRECVQDIINIADAASSDGDEVKRMRKRIDQFFAGLDRYKDEWPDQDMGKYINRLDEIMTAASTQMDTSPAASDLLEQAINYVEERRQR